VAGHLEETAETGVAEDSEEIVEILTEEMTGEEAVAERATIAIGLDTWQGIAPNKIAEETAEEEVDLVAEVVAEAEHAITATEKDTWPEIAQKETEGIEEDDNF